MCIAFFTLSQPGYKLILASNRDEFLARPTLAAGWHDFPSSLPSAAAGHDQPDAVGEGWVLSGLDRGRAEGGTWLGMTRDLRIGLLTNVRLTPPTPPLKPSPNPPSRGLLLKDFLSPTSSSPHSKVGVHDYLASHYASAGEYEGFNLLLFALSPTPADEEAGRIPNKAEVGYLTNRPIPCLTDLHIPASDSHSNGGASNADGKGHGIPAECFGISNSPMSEPWPKVIEGERRMRDALREWEEGGQGDQELVQRMFGVLAQSTAINSEEDMKSSTTIPLIKLPPYAVTTAASDAASAKSTYYGTRTSTIILVREDGRIIFVERDIHELGPDGEPRKGEGERWFEFDASSN